MSQKPTPADVDDFLDTTVLVDDPVLAAALKDSDAAGLPQIAVSAQQGKFLGLLAAATRSHRILEIGTLGGYSTICLARGAGEDGHVTTLEYEPKHAEVARANIERAGLSDKIEVIVGAALDTLPSVKGPFDLVFIDADKENYPGYLDWAVKLTHPGSLIVADNMVREGGILSPGDDAVLVGTRKALEIMGEHPQLDTAVLQVVGAKHWDGLAFALVK
jgi:predicted O-methyltransferase YrrM